MFNTEKKPKTSHTFEKFVSIANAILCLIICVRVVQMLRFSIFPLPGLYFLELITLCGAVIFSVFSDRNEKPYDWGIITWVATGIFLSFSLLGAMTVGAFFLPSTLLLLLLGVLSDLRQHRNLLIHLGAGLLAGVIQAIIMLTLFVF
jgi:hypothetical protein